MSPDTETMTALATDSGRKTPARLAGSAILACQSDERLVKLVRTGHERAFEAIVDRYRKQLVRYCRRILPESRCEDAVQQAFINAHGALTSSDEAVQLKPWLFAITRNAALNMLRQNGWNYDEIPLDFDGVRRPDQIFEERIQLQQTVAALSALPDRQRDALVMREFEGRSYNEIALALGANDGAVRQLLNRARVTLRHAASALMPPPIVARAAASMPPSDGRRMAELFGGIGAAGIAKAGATALVAGSLVVGAVNVPLVDNHTTTRSKATLSADEPVGTAAAHDTPVVLDSAKPATISSPQSGRGLGAGKRQDSTHSGRGDSGSNRSHANEHSGSGERQRSSGDTREHSGSGGSDDNRTRSGSGERSPTSGSDDHSGTSGGSGSDDSTTTTLVSSDDGTSTSGTSGDSGTSGTSGSDGTSGSGSSGSDGSNTTTTTTTSGSDSSGSSTSGTSGSSDSSSTLDH